LPGEPTSQAGLDTLNAGNVSVNFSGPMSVDNRTMGSMTVDFGTNPTWTGTWTNPGYSFGAGGGGVEEGVAGGPFPGVEALLPGEAGVLGFGGGV
jgi:hypothetical protein